MEVIIEEVKKHNENLSKEDADMLSKVEEERKKKALEKEERYKKILEKVKDFPVSI